MTLTVAELLIVSGAGVIVLVAAIAHVWAIRTRRLVPTPLGEFLGFGLLASPSTSANDECREGLCDPKRDHKPEAETCPAEDDERCDSARASSSMNEGRECRDGASDDGKRHHECRPPGVPRPRTSHPNLADGDGSYDEDRRDLSVETTLDGAEFHRHSVDLRSLK